MNEERVHRWVPLFIVLGGFGLLSRFIVSALTLGSNDIFAWAGFGTWIRQHGLIPLYAHDPLFNHPPLAGYLGAFLSWASSLTSIRFSIVFKIPVIAAEFASAALLWRIWDRRAGRSSAALALLVFGLGLDGILVSGYHGNTDCIYAFFCLYSAYLVEERGADFSGGLALGAAINIKLIPVLLIGPFVARYRSWRGAARFVGGLAVAAIPFAIVLILDARHFYTNALAYKSRVDNWGIDFFLLQLSQTRLADIEPRAVDLYSVWGRLLILAAIGLLVVAARRTERWNRYELGALTLSSFLVLTPGFGVQYTVAVVPLLCAVSLSSAALYSTLAGLCVGLSYYLYWTGTIPPRSMFGVPRAVPASLFGLLAWWTLCLFVTRTLRRRQRDSSRAQSSSVSSVFQ